MSFLYGEEINFNLTGIFKMERCSSICHVLFQKKLLFLVVVAMLISFDGDGMLDAGFATGFSGKLTYHALKINTASFLSSSNQLLEKFAAQCEDAEQHNSEFSSGTNIALEHT
jgi:hypothetical protein